MYNDSDAILEEILSRWHNWMREKPVNGVDRMDDPAFRDAPTRSGWDSSGDVIDAELNAQTMRAVDFHVGGDMRGQGGMQEPHRSAIYILARNCYTGRKVWLSPRLPKDPEERGILIQEARNILVRKLMTAGVI